MSNYNLNKTVLATALAVALVSGSAFAASVTVGTKNKQAFEVTNQTGGNNPTATLNDVLTYSVAGGDILIGRNTGNISVRITLTGAEFSTTAPTIAVPGTQGTPAAPTASVSGGVASFTITPSTTGIAAGTLFTVTAGTLGTIKATALNSLGGSVSAAVDVRDQNTGSTLQASTSANAITASQASKIVLTASADTTANVASGKKEFTVAGGAVDKNNIKLGVVVATANTLSPLAQALGSGIADNTSTGDFIFDVTGTASVAQSQLDRALVKVIFTDAAGFSQVTLGTATCATGTGTLVNDAGVLAVLTKSGNTFEGSIDMTTAGPNTLNICGRTNGTDAVVNQTVNVQAKIDYIVGRDLDFTTAAAGAKIVYDGTSIDVFQFNPAKNTSVVSYLRITNPSTTTGNITITGTCDDNTKRTASTVTLTAGHSILLTSSNVENGGNGLTPGLGACVDTDSTPANKMRLNVTGEFSNMMVQNFARNVTTAGTIVGNTNNEK